MFARDSRRVILVLASFAVPLFSGPSQASPSPAPASSSSQFAFPDCVEGCIGNSGCGLNDPKCMCAAAVRGTSFLKAVLTCMNFHCHALLGATDANFLNPLGNGCNNLGRSISQDAVQQAEAFANSLGGDSIASSTTSTPMATSTSPQISSTVVSDKITAVSEPVRTPYLTSKPAPVESTSETEAQTTASAAASTTEKSPPQTTSPTALESDSPATSPAAEETESSTTTSTTSAPPEKNTVDSNPFASPNAGVRASFVPNLWAGVLLAVLVVF